MKLAVVICAALAVAVQARQLHQSTALATITDLPQNLQALNARLEAAASSKASPMSWLTDSYEAYERYERRGPLDAKHAADKYAASDKYAADKYAEEKLYEEQYAEKFGHKYEEKFAPKYEDKYYEAIDKHGEEKIAYEHKEVYSPYGDEYKESYYGYGGPSKVTVKLFEKYRSKVRPQVGNDNTFQFTSELTCTDPSAIKDIEHEDGIITFPLLPDRSKLVTVGVCEWSVTMVKAHRISEHATLKGNTAVVCTFNEEAERHCKAASEFLCDKMTVSGQGLVYNFQADTAEEAPEKPKKPTYGADKYVVEKYAADAGASADAKKAPVDEEETTTDGETMDVFLSLINGVINTKKHMKWDNGALQYFAGEPKYNGGRDATYGKGKTNPTGQYTFVFKK